MNHLKALPEGQLLQLVREGVVLMNQVKLARTFVSRLRGLLGVRSLDEQQGLILAPCREIHMWFMGISIDVVFLKVSSPEAGEWEICSIHSNLPAWKALPVGDRCAQIALEIPAGGAERLGLSRNQRVSFIPHTLKQTSEAHHV